MARPKKNRRIRCNPTAYYFKPRGIPVRELDEIIIDHDELEALRFADLLKLSHEQAASKMKISRATFGRIVSSARLKMANGVINGKAIRINEYSGESNQASTNGHCNECGRSWKKNK